MIGSMMMVIPILAMQQGLFVALITLIIAGTVNYISCRLFLRHSFDSSYKHNESFNCHFQDKKYGILFKILMIVNITISTIQCFLMIA
jgi:amino acid permease